MRARDGLHLVAAPALSRVRGELATATRGASQHFTD